MTITQEFTKALEQDRAERDSFKPLIEKFEELKKVLQLYFKMTKTTRKWYGKRVTEILPVLNVSIAHKLTYRNTPYLFIDINGHDYIMGIGEMGDLKDRLYFISGTTYLNNKKDSTVVHITSHMFGSMYYLLENKITNVQLFCKLINDYRDYLIAVTE